MLSILFVHPDQKLSQIYTRHMLDHFLVDSARDGLMALRKFNANPPALVVSEYHLPLLSGISLLGFVRRHKQNHSIPFLFFSDHWDNSEALNLGANDWISINSAHPELLLDKIYYHLRTNKYGLQISRA
jgi:DNA-binding response OmpR family regulator